MGHRHVFTSTQLFENDNELNWSHMHAEQPCVHLARTNVAENGSLVYPVENNLSIDGVQLSSHWNPLPRAHGFSSSSHNVEVPHYRPDVPGPSHDPFLPNSVAGSFCIAPESYALHASSSSYQRQSLHGIEGGFVDHTMGSGRGPCKRKSPGIPAVCDRGSTSRYYSGGSSSNASLSSDSWQDKPNTDCQYSFWDPISVTNGYRGNSLSIGGDGSLRNVRSRSAHDLESNLARTHLSTNPLQHPYTASHPIEHSSSMDLSGQSSIASAHEWNQVHASPAANGRAPLSDSGSLSHDTNHFLVGSSITNATAEIGGYQHDFIPSRNPVVTQNLYGAPSHSVRGVRSSYSQRSAPTFRASSNNLRSGQMGMPDEGLNLVAGNYSSRHSRPLSIVGWRNHERNGRSRISNDRYRSVPDETAVRDQLASESLMFLGRSALYGTRHLFDQHRDMRLDVDNMSYEDLLALGERIGSVNTGLSEDLISKCLTEMIYCSSDQIQEDGACVICLEEYKNMDDVGTLKACGHDYHVGCIKKWLAMKNSCPICKATALADKMKEQ